MRPPPLEACPATAVNGGPTVAVADRARVAATAWISHGHHRRCGRSTVAWSSRCHHHWRGWSSHGGGCLARPPHVSRSLGAHVCWSGRDLVARVSREANAPGCALARQSGRDLARTCLAMALLTSTLPQELAHAAALRCPKLSSRCLASPLRDLTCRGALLADALLPRAATMEPCPCVAARARTAALESHERRRSPAR